LKNILEEIMEVKNDEIKKLKSEYSLSRFQDSEFFNNDRINFIDALTMSKDISIIAEIKKASPSKGIIREDFNHLRIADIYFENEVNAVSVLTDKNFFMGDIKYLKDIARIKPVPLLRKDFIIDEYQIYEAKANGADAVLLIAEILSASQLAELSQAANENNLDVLLELHSEEQIPKINFEINNLIGINNRNLDDFSVSLSTTLNIRNKIPKHCIVVSESGINCKDDLTQLKEAEISAVLVGEHFMRSENIADSVKQMKEWCINEG
jgi:indole-3-glycerol phosphate synthase